jgi:2-keto-3-deoxy-L-rhamnonate aldolase RhmA
MIARGHRFVVLGSDTALITRAAQGMVRAIKEGP